MVLVSTVQTPQAALRAAADPVHAVGLLLGAELTSPPCFTAPPVVVGVLLAFLLELEHAATTRATALRAMMSP